MLTLATEAANLFLDDKIISYWLRKLSPRIRLLSCPKQLPRCPSAVESRTGVAARPPLTMLLVINDLLLWRSRRSLALASSSLSLALKHLQAHKQLPSVATLSQSYSPVPQLLFDFRDEEPPKVVHHLTWVCLEGLFLGCHTRCKEQRHQCLGVLSMRASKPSEKAMCLQSFFWKVHHLCNNSGLDSLPKESSKLRATA